MNKKEKITSGILIFFVFFALFMNIFIHTTNPNGISYMEWFALINFIFIAYVYIVNINYQHAFSKDTNQQPYKYKKSLKTRKKWSILYLIGNLLILIIFSFLMTYYYPDGKIYFYFMAIIFIVMLYTFIRNIVILIKYKQIDPNEKYTFFGHIKPE